MLKQRNEIKAGIILSYISMSLNLLLGLLLIPYMLKKLGQEEYGLYTLIGSLVGYISLFDLGVSTTVLRYVSRYRADGNKKKMEIFIGTCFFIYAVTGFIILIVGLIFIKYLDVIFASSIDSLQIGKARVMFAILIGNLGISFVGHTYPAILKAYEKFILIKEIEISKNVIRTLSIFILLSLGFDSLKIVIVDASLNILVTTFQFLYVRFSLQIPTIPRIWDKGIVKEIYRFSSYVFLSDLINQVNTRVGSFVLGIVSTTVQIAIFGLGITLTNYYSLFTSAFSGMFMPKLTKLTVKDRPMYEIEDVLIRVSRFQAKILMLIIIGFIAVGKQFLFLWAGKGYEQSYNVLILMMIAYYLPYTQTTLNTFAQVLNKHKIRNSIYGVIAIINITLMFILAKRAGAIGAAISTCITMVIGYGVFIQGYYKFGMGVNMLRFLKETYLDTIPAAIVGLGVGIFINYFSNGTWIFLFLNTVVIMIVYVLLIWFFGSSFYEKEQVRIVLTKIRLKH